MKTFLSRFLPVFCLSAALFVGACANHPATANQGRPGTTGGTVSGAIPTADGRHSQYTIGNTVGGGTGPEYSVPTGSHIPQHYNRRGYTTDAADPSFVYDQNDIRFQTTDNVADQLRTVPGVTVRGDH